MSKESIIQQAEKYLQAGKYDKAIKEYQRLLAEDPSDMRAKLKLGDIYARKKEIPVAIATYREVALEYEKDSFHLKAIAVYKTILKLSPTLVEINEKLADLYHQVGLDQDAMNQYHIVLSVYDAKGRAKEVLEIRKKIASMNPENTSARIRLAESYQANGNVEEALQEYEQVAHLLETRQEWDSLIEVYEKMLYYRPQNTDRLAKLCRIYFEKRDFKKALRRIDASPLEVKNDPVITELWAEALLEDRQTDASRRKFKDLYASLLESGETESSVRIYSRILQEFSDDDDYLKEVEEIRTSAGLEPSQKPVTPQHRQDFERTEMIDLSKMEEMMKKK